MIQRKIKFSQHNASNPSRSVNTSFFDCNEYFLNMKVSIIHQLHYTLHDRLPEATLCKYHCTGCNGCLNCYLHYILLGIFHWVAFRKQVSNVMGCNYHKDANSHIPVHLPKPGIHSYCLSAVIERNPNYPEQVIVNKLRQIRDQRT